ncbi:Asp-tRNA(Asn)/Glu-tRNA(Gln) amidotransferase subunit GatA [Staphylococcus pseudintermedius]|uniref:Asp-tRNA(Asn)/Glu-tRNA(Gln) amidotransferase subunit GatA n=1 Tax=Staphylococcus pseudintermedius TaxID=283734 RepID=UPI00143F5615|nr:Asp-tRNA(Asn)/Glu-tRNA(Gln) amidotransferase subunit GatA [Staphylococcus pseudintermedius]EGQ0378589.1 Asp-tRNA(Asn)/Glu-tRNA(Gln) amidotransferase subunit GatA [Staphylococcus pseudintermedius]EGQ0389112.1 Asp-tRNA(Asn)/Glu-tRNA(Gln) amidotransferase subunit GatA [Staphylococcus pseudintermedius]EGQ1301665.1 Asp-tRNA(Asn)/Glu-tRNA(Gln) amidotransferase subunit GatA [Staphylococcus pseudintermedius]EGQ1634398.1 Asp-tRNA(Asn)/Glu-tRNA(Gln) amidotransferase subunit GatA [Staphylococcus pseudi
MSIRYESIENLQKMIKDNQIKPSEIVKDIYDAIEETDPTIQSFLALDKENAMKKAEELDTLQEKGEMEGKLFGIPMGIKDNIITEGLETTCASRMLEGFVPIYEATVMKKLHNENGILIGKVNLDEFAMGGSTETSYFKKTVNPFDHKAVPGGSSGGSAAAVAAGLVPFTLGTDTGGSIRQPAAYCGVVGLKPTYGRVSRFGLVAFASSLDQIGPITRNVKDNALVLEAIAGEDEMDSTSAPDVATDFTADIGKDIKDMKIALPKEYIGEGVDEEVKEAVLKAAETLKSLGAIVEEVSLPRTAYGIPSYYVIASAEASSNLARFDGIRYGYHSKEAQTLEELYKLSRSEGFGKEVKRRILLGTYVLSSGYYDAYYKKAQKVRTLIKNDFENVFKDYDVILGPTTPTVAFDLGAEINDPLTMYANDLLTTPVNLAGLPGISVPCGLAENGRPIGLQLIGKPFDEKTLYRVAHQYETQFNLHDQYQKL